MFKDVGLVEQLGSGMERILSVYDKSVFEFSHNFMKVTFKLPDLLVEAKNGGKKQKEIMSIISNLLVVIWK